MTDPPGRDGSSRQTRPPSDDRGPSPAVLLVGAMGASAIDNRYLVAVSKGAWLVEKEIPITDKFDAETG
ncbi:MAG: hypothetical protein AAF547_13650, partial [Actinomycetota bacterium]